MQARRQASEQVSMQAYKPAAKQTGKETGSQAIGNKAISQASIVEIISKETSAVSVSVSQMPQKEESQKIMFTFTYHPLNLSVKNIIQGTSSYFRTTTKQVESSHYHHSSHLNIPKT